jgi:glycosyltransferase involved in cell wall biosynthesis
MNKPTLAVVSMDIRRDLILPMRGFAKFRLAHFYRQRPYADLLPEDMDESLEQFRSPVDLFRKLRQAQPDLVQGVEPLALSQLPYQAAILLYAILHRRPMFCSAHISVPIEKKYNLLAAVLLKTLLLPLWHYVHTFFYLNRGGRRNLRRMGVPEQKLIRHMYGTWGIDPNEFTPEIDGREPGWNHCSVILFVGRLHAEKGVFDLLDAYGRIVRDRPDVKLVFIGEGPHRIALERQIAERKYTRVSLVGTVKNRDLPPYMRAATLFVSPAVTTKRWEEYVGMTNIQAMACGTPVISTRSGAIPEYVPDREAGILVPERSPAQLADAMMLLLSQEALRQRMGDYGRTYAVEHYDARKNVTMVEQYLIDLLESTAR